MRPNQRPLLGALLCAALGLTPEAQAATLACRSERALYTLNSDPAFTAGFIPSQHFASMASDLYFWVRSPQRTYWFTFDISNGYGGISLGPVGDPYVAADGDPDNGPVTFEVGDLNAGSLNVYPMLADMTVLNSPPSLGDPAPDALFTPELGSLLWYEPRAITQDKTAMRDPMDRGVFRLTGCLSETPKAGYP